MRKKCASAAVRTFRHRARSQPRRWQALRAVLAVLAVLAFFGDVWRTGHLLLTPHVRCPYDGALVHEDELPAGALALSATGSARAPLPVSVVAHHDHDDCNAGGAVHCFSAIIVPGQPEVRRAEVSLLSSSPSPRQSVTRSVLSYAPKLSPPV